MNSESEVVRFVLPEMTEREKAISSRHFWTFLVTDSTLAVYRADSGLEVLGLALGIFISSAIRGARAKKKLGKTLSEVLPRNRRTFTFSRRQEPIRLRTTQRGVIATRTVLVLTDSDGTVEIDLSGKHVADLKQHCPEIEVVPT